MASDTRRLRVVIDGDASGASGALADVRGEVQHTDSALGRLAKGMASFAARGAVALGAIGTAGGLMGLRTAAGIEQAETSFTRMLGSAEKARAFLKDLQNFANQTPFEFPDLVVAAQRLGAMGFKAKDIIPMLKSVGDAVAAMGGGKDQIDSVVRALSQMQSKGKVSGEEIMQLAENGIPALKILADTFGVNTTEMSKMIAKGLVPANKAIPALVQGMEHGTKSVKGFGGEMAKQSQTMSGKWSTFMDVLQTNLGMIVLKFKPQIVGSLDAVTNAFSNFFAGLSGKGTGVFGGLGRQLLELGRGFQQLYSAIKYGAGFSGEFSNWEKFGEILRRVGIYIRQEVVPRLQALATWLSRNRDVVIPLLAALAGGLVTFKLVTTAVIALRGAFALLTAVMAINPFVLLIAILGGLAAATIVAYKRSETFRNIVNTVGVWIKSNVIPVLLQMWNIFRSNITPILKEVAEQLVRNVWPALRGLAVRVKDNAGPFINLAVVVGKLLAALAVVIGYILRFVIPILLKLAGPILRAVFAAIGLVIGIMGKFADIVRNSIRRIIDNFLTMMGAVLGAAAKAFGWVPGLGGKLKKANDEFNKFRDRVNASLGGIKSRNVRVSATLTASAGPLGRSSYAAAQGGILRFRKYAAGGMENHVAQIAKPGTWRVWAEDETGGEAYIPLARTKRKRSTKILREVAGHFGFNILPKDPSGDPLTFASGGMVRAEDGSWVPRSFYNNTVPAGMVRAEDGSLVPLSYYRTRKATGVNVQSALAGYPQFSRTVQTFNRNLDKRVAKMAQQAFALSNNGFSARGGWPAPRLGVVSANTAAAVNFVRRVFGVNNIGTLGSRPNKSDHPYGKALDVMISAWRSAAGITLGNRVASYFQNNPNAFGTKYIIWRGRINSGRGWRSYSHPAGLGGPTALHYDHVHISLLKFGALLQRAMGRMKSFDRGGMLAPGWTLAHNGTGRPEPVGFGGGITVIVHVHGNVTAERDLAKTITASVRDEMNRIGGRNGGRTGLRK